jgi:minor extracellular serine protease Vpr
MKRFFPALVLSAFTVCACPGLAHAQAVQVFPDNPPPAAPDQTRDESPTQWFVELNGSPKADGGSAADIEKQKQSFRSDAAGVGAQFVERFSYDDLFNGLSISVKPSDLIKIKKLSSVKAVYPVSIVSLPETQPAPSPELASAITMTQADIAQNSLGLTGAGIKVAVMDTGIDYDNPDLGGCFGPGCRVEGGWDFVGDAYNNDSTSATYNPVPTPDANPDDCNGHGTHVAGIIGANGVVRGVAPGVTFRAYRVFGCSGSTSSDIMLAAMERIGKDGANVLNMSIGSALQWPEYPTAQAASRLVEKKGIVVVASAGNEGALGLYGSAAPSLGDKVIAVASYDNVGVHALAFTVSPDNKAFGYFQGTGAPTAPVSGSFPLARTGTTASTADACTALPAGSLSGKIALIRRGTCSFYIKAKNAENAGAAGVVIYNNVAGISTITVAGTPAVGIPTVSITAADGGALDGRIASGPVTLTWTGNAVQVPNTTGNLISSFSSYGMSPDLTLKPDIGAPGGFIYSTYPLELGGHATLSGTSMASPHVVGAVALLLQARPGLAAQDVRDILQNTAEPKLWAGNPRLGFLDNVHRQGAGMVQIVNAVQAPARVTPGKLSLGESESGPAVRTLTIKNDSASPITYDLAHAPALATGPNTYTPSFFVAPAVVTFSAPSVTVPAGGVATVDVTISPNAGLADRSIYGGYVVLSPEGGGLDLRVPFAGFKGDYQSIQVLVPTANGFPWLSKVVGSSYVNQPGGASYTLQGGDFPYILVHLDHQSARFELEILDAATGQPVHPVFHYADEEEHLPRNSSSSGFFAFVWDGTRLQSNGNHVMTKQVPNGRYVLVLKVLKALGDENNPAHWETWTSPVITLARP